MIPHYGAWSWRFASSSGEIYHGNGVWIADRCIIATYIHRTYHMHIYFASHPPHALSIAALSRLSSQRYGSGTRTPWCSARSSSSAPPPRVLSVSPTLIDALRGSSDSYHDRGFQPNDHSWRRDGLRASHIWSSRYPDASVASPVAVRTRSGDGLVG
jgi:hypothetical protein